MTDTTDVNLSPASGIRSKAACAAAVVAAIAAFDALGHADPFSYLDAACHEVDVFLLWLVGAAWRPWYWLTGGVGLWGLCRYNVTGKGRNLIVAWVAFFAWAAGSYLFFFVAPGYVSWRQGIAGVAIPLAVMSFAEGYRLYKRAKASFREAFNDEVGFFIVIGTALTAFGFGLLWSYHESIKNRLEVSTAIESQYGSALKDLHVVSVSYDPPGRSMLDEPVASETTIVVAGAGTFTHSNLPCSNDDFDFKVIEGRYAAWAGYKTPSKEFEHCMDQIILAVKSDGHKG